MDFIKDKVNQATETVQGKGSQAKAEEDKKVIGSGADVSTQATAAKDYVVDKKDQKSHEGKADLHDAKSDAR